MEIVVRKLTGRDAAAYHAMRLRGLREHPSAFGSTAAAWERSPADAVAERLSQPDTAGAIFGAFADGELAGIAGFLRVDDNPKRRHQASLVGMYVADERRHQGIGRRLVETVIDHARRQEGLEELILGVTVGNDAAERLYAALGFRPIYVEPRHLKLDGVYYDMLMMSLALDDVS